ncbi:aspartyl beta-hydroxylase [Terasakiispira papahanaumokuakeensis]|uniref:Aspartyl beta-hydroxylase n=1 Tax=Terasakiispira papahanaumokuakeensis TaxID=197479 RepID=A0A1E2VDM6_9GAMM|nr:aspartyl/asparaginyl beta-hydroxylase domain-containing protein [Terasakiispira papahanaumokuakeensis]ODC04765.1 aspartyl beta-hydroxylase [Terasakiispira papahanaumokuakeensis]
MGLYILLIFISCAFYVQHRGRVQHHKLSRKLTDHANVLAPLNCLYYAFSKIPNHPFIDTNQFPELSPLQAQWQTIRDEALALHQGANIKASDDLDDLGFNSFFKTGWKRYYLKWYGADLNSAQITCPKTLALLNTLPNVKGAMFAMLPPGARLVRHRDPYAGSLRYHLGLQTPESDDCFIEVDGERYSWRNGEAVMFDETYIHYAENKTDQDRIVLFLDIERPLKADFVTTLNRLFSKTIMAASATKNVEGDKVGALNKVFANVYQVRQWGKRIKAYNKTLYYVLQYGLYLLLIYWIFF